MSFPCWFHTPLAKLIACGTMVRGALYSGCLSHYLESTLSFVQDKMIYCTFLKPSRSGRALSSEVAHYRVDRKGGGVFIFAVSMKTGYGWLLHVARMRWLRAMGLYAPAGVTLTNAPFVNWKTWSIDFISEYTLTYMVKRDSHLPTQPVKER